MVKQTLEKIKGTIKNGQSRDTVNIGYERHMTKIKQDTQHKHRKLPILRCGQQRSNQNLCCLYVNHYFLECPLYLNYRRTLRSDCNDININIETLLFGTDDYSYYVNSQFVLKFKHLQTNLNDCRAKSAIFRHNFLLSSYQCQNILNVYC